MAKSKESERRPANLTLDQMRAAIPKIERRIKELEAFDPQTVNERGDARIGALETKLGQLLSDIFGVDTVEYNDYLWKIAELDLAPINMFESTPISEIREGLKRGVATAEAQLEAIKSGFLENIEDAAQDSGGRALKAYDGLELHPAIDSASGKLFRDGHYSNAIEDAVKALNDLVRQKSGVSDKDGVALMEHVFSSQKPILKFNDLADQSDKDEQLGFLRMFSGAVAGLRNPRAHKIIQDDPERALEFIAFISLLAKLADSAKK